jgi:hypothetical protein
VPDFFVDVFLAPLVAVLLTVLSVWIQQRGRAHQGRRALAEVRDDVAFLDSWLSARAQAVPEANHDQVRVEARRYLDRAYSVFAEHSVLVPSVASGTSTRRQDERPTIRRGLRLLLLIGQLERPAAKWVRALYYVMLAWALIWTSGATAVGIEDSSVGGWFIAVFLVVVMGVLPAWLVRVWAVWLDRRGGMAASPPPSPAPDRRQAPDPWYHWVPPPPPPPPPPAASGSGAGSTDAPRAG